MRNVIVNHLYDILIGVHKKHGKICSDKKEEYVSDLELYYTLCRFFSLHEKAVKIVLKTEERIGEYEELKKNVEELFQKKINKTVADFKQMEMAIEKNYSEYIECVANENLEEYRSLLLIDIESEFYAVPISRGKAAEKLYSFIDCLATRLKARKTFGNGCNELLKKGKIGGGLDKANKSDVEYNKNHLIELKNNLYSNIKSKIKGQDVAVEKFVDSYIRYKIRGKESGKPAVVSLFAGPPGTGKTYLAETFSGLLKDQGYEYKRFDMSAYGGKSEDVIGGLVGFEKTWRDSQPGQLTGFVKKHPKCVLLFDEIEKASIPVRYLFLSVLDGATLTDKFYDEAVSFENAIIIFTTNEGKELYKDNYGTSLTTIPDVAVIDALRRSTFPPELLSRFAAGNIIMFNHLDHSNMLEIFRHNLDFAVDRIQQNSTSKFEFEYDREAVSKLYLYNKGGYVDARIISANIRKYVEDEYISALEFVSDAEKSIYDIKKFLVTVDIDNNLEEYFNLTEKPRILCFANCSKLSYKTAISKLAEIDWVNNIEDLELKLENCNWNSTDASQKYSAVLISMFEAGEKAEKYIDTQGYRALLSIKEKQLKLPIMIEENVSKDKSKELTKEAKKNLRTQGVTVFVDIYTEAFKEALENNNFFDKALALTKSDRIISADKSYEYDATEGIFTIRFTKLAISKATEEQLWERKMNEKYLLDEKPQVGLKDIFGNKLAKEAVKRCIDNIKHPEKYLSLGAKLIKGILMYGAPGMGKTMLAKAIAFESGAQFISAVGSDFVGTEGVKRLEEVFETARRKKPCVIFVDEFDTIAKQRGNNNNNNNEELVLNKLLKEMDGLETNNEGVYVIAATNYRLDDLDGAVVRRFSAKICFPHPTMAESLEYLLYVLRMKNLDTVLSERSAKNLCLMMYDYMTNYSEIETFVEEAISEAIYRGVAVTEKYLYNRFHEVTGGSARTTNDINKLRAVAYHEAGHAVLQWKYGKKNGFVTIVSRGRYSGYAIADSSLYTGNEFLQGIRISLAGRMAEMMSCGSPEAPNNKGKNRGAYSDLQKATNMAYDYVTRFAFGSRTAVVPARLASAGAGCLENILPEKEKEAIWKEVSDVLEREKNNTKEELIALWKKVEAIATSLLFMKELDGEAIERIIETEIPIVDEACFEDQDGDIAEIRLTSKEEMSEENILQVDNTITYPYGYPIYPRSIIRTDLRDSQQESSGEKTYYYAVRDKKNIWGIFQNLYQAFAVAYQTGASCRRFTSKEVAEEYLSILELKVSKINGESHIQLYVDGLNEIMEETQIKSQLKVIDQSYVESCRPIAENMGISVKEYFEKYEIKEKLLTQREDFQVLYVIYVQEIMDVVLEKWG